MSSRMSRGAYKELVNQDIEWLRKQPRTLERDHILGILDLAVDYEYPPRIDELVLEKIRIGDHLEPKELDFAVKWFDDLRSKLEQLGERYHLAWEPIFRLAMKLKEMKMARDGAP